MKYVPANDNKRKAKTVYKQFNVATDTPVIFRKSDDEVVAYFPSLRATRGHVVCYAHVGQHGEASESFMRDTKPATEDEYSELLAELRNIYETGDDATKLLVRKRDSDLCRWMRYENKTA